MMLDDFRISLKRLHDLALRNGQADFIPFEEVVDNLNSAEDAASHIGSILTHLVEWCGSALTRSEDDGATEVEQAEQDELCWSASCVVEAEMLQSCLMAFACLFPPLRPLANDDAKDEGRCEREHELVQLLSKVALEIDGLSIYLFTSLCRDGCDPKLRSALEGSVACLLLCMVRASRSPLSIETVLELVHGDALWAFHVAKAVMNWRENEALPEDSEILATSVLVAVLSLHKPHLAFLRESTLAYNTVPIDSRHEVVRQHRAEVASAFAHSCSEGFLLSKCGTRKFLPELASFLACIAGPGSVTLEYSEQFWELFLGNLDKVVFGAYWTDCAVLSIANPPKRQQCECFLQSILCVQGQPSLPSALAVICVLVASAGILPCEPISSGLQDRIRGLPLASYAKFRAALEGWRGLSLGCEKLSFWLSHAPQAGRTELHSIPQDSVEEYAMAEPLGLRYAFSDAPRHLCCQLDGQLMLDPVRSPAGHLFERWSLSRALQECSQCPVTAVPLSLSDCRRSPRVRAQVLRWVRMQRDFANQAYLCVCHATAECIMGLPAVEFTSGLQAALPHDLGTAPEGASAAFLGPAASCSVLEHVSGFDIDGPGAQASDLVLGSSASVWGYSRSGQENILAA